MRIYMTLIHDIIIVFKSSAKTSGTTLVGDKRRSEDCCQGLYRGLCQGLVLLFWFIVCLSTRKTHITLRTIIHILACIGSQINQILYNGVFFTVCFANTLRHDDVVLFVVWVYSLTTQLFTPFSVIYDYIHSL